ncbi:peroxidase 40 isoform X3 [Solanum tuberosum]|uniref:peroxidase 40 isoform X3 n=1 Tax=Solanum tuberosum TaxID=4113 RepID=UPI00073A371B|nr:PREDICTED: peroxidase 40 isoform X3 [Solanum tuberosum]
MKLIWGVMDYQCLLISFFLSSSSCFQDLFCTSKFWILILENQEFASPLKGMIETTTEEVLRKAGFRNVRFLASFITEAGILLKRSKGCDASVLLDDTPNFSGEKTAGPNLNSLRGFEVIDNIKADLEYACPQTVSCADILSIAARDSVVLSGGLGWQVQMGRKDSLTASKTAANNNIPGPNSNIATLVTNFQNLGLSLQDMVTLSGAHTIGKARCATFSSRLNNNNAGVSNSEMNLDFLQSLQQLCSANNNTTLANLDDMTPSTFDNHYYVNLLSGKGLLVSDQVLATGDDDNTREIVQNYVDDPSVFLEDFKNSMLKMGSLPPPTGTNGEIRVNCRVIN